MKPRVIILRTAGTNCDYETAHAFGISGAEVELVHVNRLKRKEKELLDYQILVLPGGFTYGDDISAGKVLSNELKFRLGDDFERFVEEGRLVLGICNGFQVLVKMGYLPDLSGRRDQEVTLSYNDSGKFEDRWVYLKESGSGKCIFTQDCEDLIYLPVAHSEGKFVPRDEMVLKTLRDGGQIVLTYVNRDGESSGYPDNPNGSIDGVAGICDRTGRIFGLMPHPERHTHSTHHPRWTREGLREPDGLIIFRNAVRFAKQML
ncbi:MAG: phosphoribosylformylglycinamidine synthase [Latescibacteria bacterium DG_63]|nr:MAG: phosphoribosylformylglycinamidine synthase [Latescibacteria bacterium DG_63]